ncbi:MAG: hypothetical protein FD140_1524 [Limisphaerales bacterium]|nr:MAG: hypothetical protein FD140_1524 [Limisphaerales bacterium]
MKQRLAIITGLLVVAAVVFSLRRQPRQDAPETTPKAAGSRPAVPPAAVASNAPRPPAAPVAVVPPVEAATARPQFAADQGGPLVILARFKAWSEKYAVAGPDQRAAMVAEGGALATERRAVMREMIEKNPRLAVEQAVPYGVRKALPPEIRALLEEVVSGRANFKVFGSYPAPGQKAEKSVFRQADINGRTFDAYVYGQRVRQRTDNGVALYGVALDNALAVAESPLRPLDAVEAKDLIAVGKAPTDAVCSVSGLKTTVVDAAPTPAPAPAVPLQSVPAAAPVQAAQAVEVTGTPQASQALQTSYGDFGGQVLAFCRPSHVGRFGRLAFDRSGGSLNQVLAGGAVSSTSGGGSVPGYTYTQGTKTILYMRLAFPDDQTVPITEDQAYQDLNDLNNYFVQASHGTFSIQGVVTPVLMMPQTKVWYSIPAPTGGGSAATPPKVLADLYTHARNAAAEAGFYFADYDWDCIRFTSIPGASWGGLGSVGGRNVWLQSNGLGVIGHEFGHNLGLLHANFWDTTPGTAPGGTQESSSAAGHNTSNGTGASIDYGDFFCMMGIGFPGQYNTYHKWNLGWLADSAVAMFNGTTNASSTVRLHAMDAPLVLQNRQHAIRVRRTADREYWFQFRTEITANQWLQNGLQTLWTGNAETGDQNGDSDLLDMTPNSTLGKTDSPLPVGQTFHDPQINLFITPLNRSGVGSNAFMDVVINIGHFPTNVAPSFGSLTVNSNSINPGDTVTFTAAVTDANNDQLAYHWDFADLSVSTNTPVVSHTFTNAGEYVVRCVATDMKGGTASKSIVITVGNPGTFRISGIVRFPNFAPVPDVRVDNGLTGANYGYSYTDSDGSFTLVNLPNGTYNIGAWKHGYHFEPFTGQQPQGILIANVNDSATIWLASQLPVVSISNLTSVVEGNVATVMLNRSGPTNAGLDVVLVTPFADTFFFNNAVVSTDFTQTNGIAVIHTNANSTNIQLLQVTFPAGISNLTLTFPTTADAGYEGAEHFFVDLADPFQFPNSFFQNPVFVTNYPMIPGWRLNANPQTYAYLPTSTVIRTDPSYVIGRPVPPTPAVQIQDSTAPTLPTISVFASGNVALESGFDPGEFAFTTSSVLTNDLTVFYTMSGTASNGQDYVLMPGSFVMPANTRLFFLSLVATNDYFVEGQEAATLTISPNANYVVGTAAANMTIVDDDLPSVSVSSLDSTAAETGGNPASFTFTRTGNLDRALTVDYVVSGGAVSGTDFNTLPGSITIPLGQTRATVTLTAIDDGIAEGDETVIVTIVDSVFYNTGSPNSARAIIQDDEQNTITVATTGNATEGGSGSFTLTRTGSTNNPVTVFYTAGGSAFGGVGADYNSIGTAAVIPAGSATVVIPVTTIDDNFFEAAETVILTVATNSTYNVGSAFQASMTITDNDSTSNPSVGFMLGSSGNPEYSNTVTLAVYLSAVPPMGDLTTNGTPSRIKVEYGVSGGDAVNGTDFTLASGTLIWRNGTNFGGQDPAITDDLIQNITFTVNNDLLLNGERSFVVTLSNRVEAITYDGFQHNFLARMTTNNNPFREDTNFAIGFGPNARVNALHVQPDNFVVAAGDFTALSPTTNTSVSALRVARFQSNGIVDATFAFPGTGSNVLAIAAQSDGRLIFGGTDTNSAAGFNTNRLMRLLSDGQIDGTFNTGTGPNRTNVYAVAVESVTDKIYIGGDFLTYNGVNHRKFARLNSDGSLDGSFGGTGFFPGDEVYAILPIGLTNVLVGGLFTNYNGTFATNLIMLNTNGTVKWTADVNGAVRGLALEPINNTIIVVGDFSTVNTSNATRIVSLQLSDGQIDLVRNVNQKELTANVATLRTTISHELRVGDPVIIAISDAVFDGNFTVTGIAEFTPGSGVTNLFTYTRVQPDVATTGATGTVTRRNTFRSATETGVNEDAGANGTVRAIMRDGSGRYFVGGDFSAWGTNTAEFFARINNNGTFQRTLSPTNNPNAPVRALAQSSTGQVYLGGDFQANVFFYPNNYSFDIHRSHTYTIKDDDAATVTVTAPASPDGSFQVTRAGSTAAAIAVNFNVTGTATRGSDYLLRTNGIVLGQNTVTIPAGTNSVLVAVEAIDDGAEEFEETVRLTITSVPSGKVGAPQSATIYLADNDGSIQFDLASFAALEGAGVVPITIRRSGNTSGTNSVDYVISNGSAVNGVDFFGTNGTVTFFPGQLTTNFTITLTNDTLVEGNETVLLALANAQGGLPLGGQSTATLNVIDDDTAFQFSVTNFLVAENGGNGNVTIYRLGLSNAAHNVEFRADSGSATSGADFTGVTNVLTFNPGVTNMTVPVTILDDSLIETNETVTLTLLNPTGGSALGISNTVAQLTILEDESQLVFSATNYPVNEYAGTVVITVNRLGGTVNPVTVNFNTANGTAAHGSDYFTNFTAISLAGDVIVPSTNDSGVTIQTPGRITTNITVNLIDDVAGEVDETVLLALTAPAGGPVGATTLGTPSAATITILDNEQAGDPVFEYGLASATNGANGRVLALGRQSSGLVIVGGEFTAFDGNFYNRLARLLPGGSVDTGFIIGTGASSNINALSVLSNDKILIGGAFTNFNGTARGRIARLNANGSLDGSFDPGTGADDLVRTLAVLTNGQVLIGGDFTNYNGTNVNRLARLNDNGTFDTNFTADVSGPVHSLVVDAAGRVVIGGAFTTVNGSAVTNVARLLTNGVLDPAFTVTGVDNTVAAVVLQGDGKVLIGGAFTNVNTSARNSLARLLTNGVLDAAFAPGTGPNGLVHSIATDANGKILIGGDFTNYNGTIRSNFARIKGNGQPDPFFRPGRGANAGVRAVLALADTAMILGGDFTAIDGITRNRVAKVHGDEVSNIATMELAAATFQVDENIGNASIPLVRYGATNIVSSVTVFTADGSATHPLHYTGITNVVTFALGERNQTVNVPIVNGTDPNAPRTLSLALTNASNGFLDTITNAVLTVNDNDVVFAFATNVISVLESAGTVTVGILRFGSLQHAVGAEFSTADGTAQSVFPADFTAQANVPVLFSAGVTSNFVTVTVLDDVNPESNESANLLLTDSGTNNPGLQVTVTNAPAALTIRDDDNNPGQFAFSSATYSVSEGAGSFAITVVRAGGFVSTNGSPTVDITVTATNGTATSGVDFIGLTNVVAFTNLQVSGSTTLLVNDDALTNGSRTVSLSLIVTDPLSGAGLMAPSTSVLTITDDDNGPGTFNFATNAFSVSETATNVTITIVRSAGSLGAIGLQVVSTNLTATHTNDYVGITNNLIVADGQVSTNVSITLLPDDVVEGDESFGVRLTVTSGGAILGATSNAVVTILDDDALVRFLRASTNVNELVNTVVVNLERVGSTNGTATVQIQADPSSTANAGSDYVNFGLSTVTFPPGVTQTNFTVTIVDDFVFEPPEVLTLGLVNPAPTLSTNAFGVTTTNSGVFLGTNLFDININDNDTTNGTMTIGLAPGQNFAVEEGAVTVTFRVRRQGGNSGSINVDWRTTDDFPYPNIIFKPSFTLLAVGSDYATPGVDYTATGGNLTWADADPVLFRDITVTLLDDSSNPVPEFNKDLFVRLYFDPGSPANTTPPNIAPTTNVTGSGLGGGQIRLTIVDDDQPGGALDRTWNLDNNFGTTPTFNILPGANNTVQAIAVQADDRSVIGGEFTAFNAQSANRIARVNTDGSFDSTFNPGLGANNFVAAVAIHTNAAQAGRIMVGGGFTSIDGTSRNGIARLLATGALDASFNPGAGFNGSVRAIAIQPDGKIVVGGSFTAFNGTSRTNLARLNADGTLDTAFDPVNGANGTIYAVALSTVSADIYVGGDFTTYNGAGRARVARLGPTGLLDASFDPGTGADGVVFALAVEQGGNVLLGGSFAAINQVARRGVARLLPSGVVDPAFNPGTGANNFVSTIALQTNDQAVIGGSFTIYNGSLRKNLARLLSDGTLDTTFMDHAYNSSAGPTNASSFLSAVAIQSDGNVMIGGSFSGLGAPYSRINSTSPSQIATASVPANTNATELARMRWTQTKPRGNLARMVGRGTPGPGNVHFESAAYTVNESAGQAAMRLTRINGFIGPVGVNFSTADITAVAGADYTAQSGTVRWNSIWTNSPFAGELRVGEVGPLSSANNSTIFLTLINDSAIEPNETVDFTLGAVSGSFVLGSNVVVTPAPALAFNNHVTLTIVDDEFTPGVLGFSASTYSTIENAATAAISIFRTNGSMGVVTVDYTTSPNGSTATAGTDYTAVAGTLTFQAGETNKAFNIPLLNDVLVELDETVTLLLTNATGGATLGLTNASLVLTDDDFSAGRVTFTATNYAVIEGADNIIITVLRNGGSVGTASALFYTTDGTAVSGTHYTGVTNSLTWANGDASSRTITLSVSNNFAVDGTRGLTLTLTNILGALAGSVTNATGTIQDDDAFGVIAFSSPAYAVAENGGQVTITAVRTGGNGGTVGVDFFTDIAGGTATANVDYTPVSIRLTMAEGVVSASATVPVLDNAVASQPNKTVMLRLQNVANATLGSVSNAALTLIDDESFNVPAGSVDTTFTTLAGANGFVQAVALQPDGRLVIGGDFTLFNNVARGRLARINPDGSLDTSFLLSGTGAGAAVLTLALQPDGRVIAGGSFTNLNSTNRNRIARLNSDGAIDSSFNPGAGVDNPVFASAVYTTGANSGKILIGGAFSTFNGSPRNCLARLNSDGSLDTSFVIGNGANGNVHAITIQSDGKVLVGGDFTAFNGAPRTAGLARLNSDGSVDASFNPTGPGVNGSVRVIRIQSDGKLLVGGLFTTVNGVTNNFYARLSRDADVDTAFGLAGVGGADNAVYAIELQGDDKILLAGDFTRCNGVTRNRITRLNANGTVDPTINFGTGANGFIGALALPFAANGIQQIVAAGGFTTFNGLPANYLTRLNGGSLAGAGRLEFLAAAFSGLESAISVPVSVIRQGGTSGNATNTLLAVGGTAVNGVHYNLATTTLAFPPGEVIQTVNIPVTNDLVVNVDRTVSLVLSNFVTAAAGNQTNATLTIVNDDTQIGFSSATYSVNENVVGGFVAVTVTRTGSTVGSSSADFRTSAGPTNSATAGVDYTTVNTVLTFVSGESLKTVNIPIIDDAAVEGNETITLTLTNITGAAGITTATLTVVENDFAPGELSFSANSFTVNEAGGSATITVLRSNGFTGVISVNYATAGGGTAVAGVDYTTTSGTLAFADGQISRTFTVPILPNTGNTNNLTVNLQLNTPTGGAVVNQSSAVLTILNNDVIFGNFNFTNTAYSAYETNTATQVGGTFVTEIAVSRDGGSNGLATVAVILVNGTATNGVHYQAQVTNLLSWADGVGGLKTFYVTNVNNPEINDPRTVTMLLTNATGGASIGATNTITYSILDDEVGPGEFRFAQAGFTVLESGTNAQVLILRTNGFTATNGPVTVTLVTTNNTASNGVHYTGVTNVVNFTNAQTSATVSIPILDNLIVDGNKTVGLLLENATGSATILTPSATLTIVEDDPVAGSVDGSFNPGTGPNAAVNAIGTNGSGQLIIAGDFTRYNNQDQTNVARLLASGALDTSFVVPPIANGGGSASVLSLAAQTDGKVLIGGQFTSLGGATRLNLARLNTNGTLDAAFDPVGGADSIVHAVAVQNNQRIVVGGDFTTIAGASRSFIARLNADGTIDNSFDPGFGPNGAVRAVVVDGSGNVVVGGEFTTFNGTSRRRIVRLTSAGAVDATFNPGTNLNGTVSAIALQSDGKILIGGLFTQYGASPRAYVARLNSDGSLDTSFNPGAGLDSFVSDLALLADGRVVVGGGFTAFNGISRNRVAILTAGGALDPTSNLGTGANSFVAAILVQGDGRVVLGGGFTAFNGVTANYLTRINAGVNLGSGTIGFSASNYDVAENAGSVTVTVIRSAGTSNAVAVAYALTPGSAVSGTHYESTSGTLVFNEGETLRTFTVNIMDDVPTATNAPRTVNLLLTPITAGPINTAPALLGATAATITILDRDSELGFAVADFVVGELAASATITVLRSGSSSGTVQVNYATVAGGTATAGVDYSASSGALNFADGVTSQTFTVPILDDAAVEGNETVALALSSPVGMGVGAVLGPVATATLTIIDNELSPGRIAFSAATYTVSESSSSRTITVVRTNGTQSLVSVNYATSNGTATAGADYVATSGSLIWASGDSASKSFTVTILPDIAVEGNETVNLTLSGASGGAVITGPTATLTIQDDDDLVQFAVTAVSAFESAGNVAVAVQRVGAGNATVTVNYNTVPGGTANYTPTNGILTFAPGVNLQNIVVGITNDTATNAARTFDVQLTAPGGASLGAGSLATVTVLDDDSVLQFATNAVSVSESLNSVTLTVTRTGMSNSAVSVQFTTTTNGTATNNVDYLATNGVLVFATNVITGTITVPLINDTTVEPDETFTVALSAPVGEASLGAFTTNTVTILNDDNIVQFATGTHSVVERAGSVTLTVVRTGASNGVVTVPFTSASVTAFAGSDFTATNGTLTFGTNVVTTNLIVPILNDLLVESSETFTVTLGTPTGESSLGPTNSATITIVDDESTLEFVQPSLSVLESSGTLAVQLTRVGALDSAVTLPFSFINGSATNAVDYLGTNGIVIFGVGVNQQSITVGLVNDVAVEPNKTFSILLGTPGGEAVLGTRTVVNVTILDDDSVLQFPAATLNISESAQNATISVQRTGATNVSVTVNLSTVDGPAQAAEAGLDYGAVTTNVVFGLGENLKSFTVPIVNDSLAEGTEVFRVLLNSVIGEGTLGATTTLTVQITDDDFRTLVAAGYSLVAEGYVPTNNAVDPLESVTVNFSLRNIGNVPSPDISATLLVSGGVLNPSGPQVYTNLTNGALQTMPFTFTAAQVQTVTASLQLSDSNGPAGVVSFPIDLGAASSFSNRTLINIPGTITVPSFGPASPYPNAITVTNVTGLVNKVTVRLHGFSHSWPADVDILLVGPGGQKVVLMSDAGSGNSVNNLTLTFDDAASSTLPELTTILEGTFRPTDYAPADSFPAPAPAGPYSTSLSVFNGSNPTGTWTLYIVDDTDQNIGSILTGWSLHLSTVSPLVNLTASMTNSSATVVAPGLVTFTTTITNQGPNSASSVVYSNVLPAGLTLVSVTNSAGSSFTVVGSTVAGNLGPLGTGAVHTVTLTASTSGNGLLTNTAVVFASSEVELAPADNTASSVVAITSGPLGLVGSVLGGGSFSLTLTNTVAGRNYVLEGTTNLVTPAASTVWLPLATNLATGSTMSVTNADAGGFLRRFYRAIER